VFEAGAEYLNNPWTNWLLTLQEAFGLIGYR